MNLIDAIRQRRSVKVFDPEHEVSDDELKFLFSHAALAPSSFNMQNWHFVAVRDKETKAKLCEASWNQAQVRDAGLVVVLAGNFAAHKRYDRYLRKAPEETRKMFEGMIGGFYDGNDDLQMQEACRSIGIVGMTMMLLAKEMGYESCPMIGFDPKKVTEIVGLPADHPPLMMVTIGRGAKPARPRMGLLDLEELVSLDKFGENGLTGEVADD